MQNLTTYTLRNYRCGMLSYLLAVGNYCKCSHALIQEIANYNFCHTANCTEFGKFLSASDIPQIIHGRNSTFRIPHNVFTPKRKVTER